MWAHPSRAPARLSRTPVEKRDGHVWAMKLLVSTALLGLLLSPSAAAAGRSSDVHVVPGRASVIQQADGEVISFTAEGFAPLHAVSLSVDGASHGTATSSRVGTVTMRLPLPANRVTLLAAAGPEPSGRLRVVTAEVRLPASSSGLAQQLSASPSRVYADLGAGLAIVLLCVVVVFGSHALRRSRRVSP